ncbi:MAG: twin-arginine translocase TatA/TatE family subunit [Verrucomicrobia bacterium]|nr:twin-arginine translocase TatA/TatE family subunit [Pseudomonadota bacterium]NBS06391.1 twin-arginine translocase TatA/TatE family subunit [Verrucomicrobiota bacterium]NBS78938.1 twin-arginine translocase TatA/TatE family subunit [bacterium]NBS50735.1 twin-arginine translocase TatA/TatE family subunit [Verrucomicrobiota bacterium]NBT23464.1 twin-arginine translocase TatA/TatE family subunit [bacterium]
MIPLPLALGLPQGSEWFWIVLVIILLFGAKKLPELARSIGRSLGEFSRAKDEFEKEVKNAVEEGDKKDPSKKSS